MGKQLKDYLTYYIGRQCVTPDGIGILVGLPWHLMGQDRVKVHFGSKMIKTVNSIDGGYDTIRNHGEYAIKAERYEPIGATGKTEDGFDMPGGVKPILRKLSDMAQDEAIELVRLVVHEDEYKNISLYRHQYTNDLMVQWGHLTPEQRADDVEYFFNATGERSWSADQFHYLLKQGFDLFGLLDAGLAVDEKTLTK